MKPVIRALLFTLTVSAAPLAQAATSVSISIGEPGFYGQIDLGDVGPPQLIYRRPVVIDRRPRVTVVEPIYLRVPPGHSRNWKRYCSRYDACGRPVYFVRDDWYSNVYVPRYRESHRHDRREERRDDRRDERRDERRDDRSDDRRDDRH